ncbi:MAG: type II toxin-antitoxin system VapC family toxin [Candidatus Limnocylindria bacterium]
MTRYVLDTTFIIDHLRGDPAATARFARLFADGDQPVINEVAACEAWTGAPIAGDPALESLLQVTEFVQPGPDSARRAGVWRQEARERGHVLGLADALIAAAADEDAIVLTRNVRDFMLTPARLETY